MARPRKGEEKNTVAAVGVRMSGDLRLAIEHYARINGGTLADEARLLLQEAVDARSSSRDGGKPRPAVPAADPNSVTVPLDLLQTLRAIGKTADTLLAARPKPRRIPVPTIPATKPEPVK
ncbi:MAG: hypothetical protein RIQ79_711 [Verrucomicrobiota bacterium]|jgi:hypothetical protein